MSRSLDAIDAAILRRLQEDGRVSNKDLAEAVGLAPSSCLERVRKLRADGVLIDFHARVDPAAVGVGLQALVAVRLHSQAGPVVASLADELGALAEVVSVFQLSGADDLLLHVACRDVAHLRELALDALGTRPEVRHVETSLIFAHRRGPLPVYGGEP